MPPPPVDKQPPKAPPKVSQAYLTGKSSRPKAPMAAPSAASSKLFFFAGGLFLLTVGSAGYAVYARAANSLQELASLSVHAVRAGQSAQDIAGQIRERVMATGGVPLEDGIEVTVPELREDDTPQKVSVQVRYRVVTYGIPITQSLSVQFPGRNLAPSSYKGDGQPKVDPAAVAKLEKALATARCPDGTQQKGEAPPKGHETWCERPAANAKSKPVKHGPYFAWHPNGAPMEEGTYKEGKRDGRWTRFDTKGARNAEAYYKDDVQHGRFRTWDASGTQTMDVEYTNGVPARR